MLRNLPYELGKLFHLVLLGLHGNPLTKDILSIYNDINGTNKLLTHMLDSYSREYQPHFDMFSELIDTALFLNELCLPYENGANCAKYTPNTVMHGGESQTH